MAVIQQRTPGVSDGGVLLLVVCICLFLFVCRQDYGKTVTFIITNLQELIGNYTLGSCR